MRRNTFHTCTGWLAGVGGAIALTLSHTPDAPAQSLIVPDDTLGAEGSVVLENFNGTPNEVIVGGAQRAENLFHSFEEFNVDEGRGAFFFSPDGIANIFSRVTGANPSNILGSLGTFGGEADLFFMNPNGIVFGPNSSLNVAGSFAAVTSEAIEFGEQGIFSAVNPEVPSDLLTVDPSAFLFGDRPSGAIVNTSVTPVGFNSTSGIALGLRVPDGQTLILLGGDVVLDGSQPSLLGSSGVNAFGGRIEIGGLSGRGAVALNRESEAIWSLGFPQDAARADVSIVEGVRVDVVGGGGGDIAINGRNVDISEGSGLFAGIGLFLGSPGAQAGDIEIDATGSVVLSELSTLVNAAIGGVGDAGAVQVSANSIDVLDGSVIVGANLGQGNVGDISLAANETITLAGRSADNTPSGVSSGVVSLESLGFPGEAGTGESGTIEFDARQIVLADGAQVGTSNFSAEADSGDVRLSASDAIRLRDDGTAIQAVTTGQGSAGNITLESGNTVELTGGAFLSASSDGQGDSGSITVRADNTVVLEGVGASNPSGLFNSINAVQESSDRRQAGDILIETDAFTLRNGASLQSNVEAGAVGESGDIVLRGNSALIEGGQIQSLLRGEESRGTAGDIRIEAADAVVLNGETLGTAIVSAVGEGATGNGGTIAIDAGSLSVVNGASLDTRTLGEGDGGDIVLEIAGTVEFNGTTPDNQFASGIFSSVGANAVGTGGSIRIDAGNLSVTNGAALDSGTFGTGDAGSFIFNIAGATTIDGTTSSEQFASGITSRVANSATGNGGRIELSGGSLAITNGAVINANTAGNGNSGAIFLDIEGRAEIDGAFPDGESVSAVSSAVDAGAVGEGGDIELDAGSLSISNGARIGTGTFGDGDSGGIRLRIDGAVELEGTTPEGQLASSLFTAVSEDAVGDGGDIELTAGSLAIARGAELNATTSGTGNSGTIILNIQNAARLEGTAPGEQNNSGIFSFVDEGATGNGGDIELNAMSLEVLNGAALDARTLGRGNAGNITVEVVEQAVFDGVSANGSFASGAFSTIEAAATGESGDIDVSGAEVEILNGAVLAVSTAGDGNAGDVSVSAGDRLRLDGVSDSGQPSGIFTSTEATATGQGGSVLLTSPTVTVHNGAVLNGQTRNNRRGGSFTVNANRLSITDGSQLIVTTFGSGRAGDIVLDADQIALSGGLEFSEDGNADFTNLERSEGRSGLFANTRPGSSGRGGSIDIDTLNISIEDGAVISTQSDGEGNAGSVVVFADQTVNLRDRAQITSSTSGQGNAGRLSIRAIDSIRLSNGSTVTSDVRAGAEGNARRLTLQTSNLDASGNSRISATTSGSGNAGDIRILEADSVRLDNSTVATTVNRRAETTSPSNITLQTRQLSLSNGANITSTSDGQGDAGTITIQAVEAFSLNTGSVSSEVGETANGNGGDITIRAGTLSLSDRSLISAQSLRTSDESVAATSPAQNRAGNLIIVVDDLLTLENSDITTQAAASTGGAVTITATDILFVEDGDIRTNVQRGAGGGGAIVLTADSILAFADSDILAFAQDGRGGDVTLDTPIFFGENFDPIASSRDPIETLEGNNRVDINASGAIAGTITIPDVTFIQNSLNDLPASLINTEDLIANSCVVRNADGSSTFVITGSEGLPARPSDSTSDYPTGAVQTVPDESREHDTSWQVGDPIVEPQGVYQLPNGELVLSHRCR